MRKTSNTKTLAMTNEEKLDKVLNAIAVLVKEQEKTNKRLDELEKKTSQKKTNQKSAKTSKKQAKTVDVDYKEVIDARENKELVAIQKEFKEAGYNAKFEKTARENYSLCIYGVEKDDDNIEILKENGFKWYSPKACWYKTK